MGAGATGFTVTGLTVTGTGCTGTARADIGKSGTPAGMGIGCGGGA
jgi:hypothetical protein